MELPKSPSLEMFGRLTTVRLIYVIGGILLLVAGSAVLALEQHTHTEAFRFIMLLVVFMAALAITATVFSGLHLADKKEAFGLPSGSVRALLAVGIILLFVVFGLPLVAVVPNADPSERPKPIATVSVPYDKIAEAARMYTDQHLNVIVTNYGAPTVNPGQANEQVHPATVEVRPPDYYAERFDISKQLVTAIITLLTSVISFYFGSRSVSDAMKSDAKNDDTTTDLAVRRKELATRVETLKASLSDRSKKVDETSTIADPASADEAKVRQTAAAAVTVRRAALDDQIKAIANQLSNIDQVIANLGSATPADVRGVNEQSAKDGLSKLDDALKNAEGLLPAYDSEIAAYEQASAVG